MLIGMLIGMPIDIPRNWATAQFFIISQKPRHESLRGQQERISLILKTKYQQDQ